MYPTFYNKAVRVYPNVYQIGRVIRTVDSQKIVQEEISFRPVQEFIWDKTIEYKYKKDKSPIIEGKRLEIIKPFRIEEIPLQVYIKNKICSMWTKAMQNHQKEEAEFLQLILNGI